MAIFTAIATAIVGAIGITGVVATVATSLIAGGLALGVSKLIMPKAPKGGGVEDTSVTGIRVQLPPATNNKLPVVYGTAFVGGSIIDAKISTDLQTMWYVIAMTEVTNTMPGDTPDTLTFDQIYYDNKLVTFGVNGAVSALTTNTQGGGEVDTKVAGNLFIYLFPNGSSSGTNTGGQTAIDILSDATIPAGLRWNSALYTTGGQSASMTNCSFVIVKIKYNQDAGTTSLGAVTAKITNSRTKPGDCIKDYLLNDRYGCAVALSQINTTSLTDLNTYSDLPCYYTPAGGGPLTSQARYRFNGPIDTSQNCLANLNEMVDACDSWMQYSELTGQWKVVINKAYDEAPDAQTFNDLYSVTSTNLIGGINITPSDLNQTYNQIEYQYPNTNIKDQTDYVFIALQDEFPSLLSENEPVNKMTVKNDLVNNFVQAKFISIRRILQSREDLIISFQTDYSGIQVEAGDVIKVTLAEYGWTNKLFRVSNVTEEKYPDGNLGTKMVALEYNGTIYDDDLDITDFIPEDNTGLSDPNIIDQPDPPTVVLNQADTLYSMDITGVVPNVGLVRYLEFNYGTDSNSANHLYKTNITNSNGAPLVGNTSYTVNVNDIQGANTLYWSVTARNDQVGIRSNSSASVNWPGANVSTANNFTACNASSSGTLVTSDSIPTGNIVGGIVTITSGTGTLQANTIVANVVSNTQFNLNLVPTVALSNACIQVQVGGITGNNIGNGTISGNNIGNGTITGNNIANGTIDPSKLSFNTAISVQDQGNLLSNNVTILDFVGNGVTATGPGNTITINVPGSSFPVGTTVELITGPESDGSASIQNANRSSTNGLKDFNQGVGSGQGIGYLTANAIGNTSYYFPFLQGTSDTANLYQANSTAALGTPSGSPFYTASAPTPTGAGWIGPLYASYSGSPPNLGGWALVKEVKHNSTYTEDKDFYYMCFTNFQVTADADTTLYYAGSWSQTSGAVNNHYIGSEKIGSIDIKAWRPYYISYNFAYRGNLPTANTAVQAMALWMRNTDTGNVFVTHTDMLIKSTDGLALYVDEGYPWSPDA